MKHDVLTTSESAGAAPPALAGFAITKHFGATKALRGVDLTLHRGRIHAIVGENGAGKSTLTAIFAGALQPDDGHLELGGDPIAFASPSDALERGIGVVYQELSLLPEMTVSDNIMLDIQPLTRRWFIDRDAQRSIVEELLAEVGGEAVDPGAVVKDLPIAQQQLVEIAKVLAREPLVIILDEPTAMLPADDSENLLEVIRRLSASGVAVGYVSHRLDEVLAVADEVSVLRDGDLVWTRPREGLDLDEIVRAMVGRSVDEVYPERVRHVAGEPVLEVRGVQLPGTEPEGVSFTCHRGEILGVAGLMGSGRSRLARFLIGLEAATGGEVTLHGEPYKPRTPRRSARNGIVYVPEERKKFGLILPFGIDRNVGLPSASDLSRFGLVNHRREISLAERVVEEFGVKTESVEVPMAMLSGGNQQKVVIGKWLVKDPELLILDEPLRGIDINAKSEIHRALRDLADAGLPILLISSELPELLEISDRLLVMRDGRIVGEFDHDEFVADTIMTLATSEAA